MTTPSPPLPEPLATSVAEVSQAKVRARLTITIPVLMMVFPILAGVCTFQAINTQAARLNDELAGRLLETLMPIWYSTAALILAAAICGILLSHYITKPIHKLIKSVEELAEGDLQQSVQIQNKDEFAVLGNSFNQMVQSLNRTIQERNRYILECYTGGLITADLEGRVMAINSAAEQILEVRGDELLGRPLLEHLEERAGLGELARAVRQGMEEERFVQSLEISIATTEGTPFPLMVTTSMLKGQGGAPSGTIVNFRDLTEFKAFHQRLSRTDRLATAGTLAMGVAHEIRNPLASIRGMAQLLQQDVDAASPSRRFVDVIVSESRRLDSVISELLDFTQPDESALEACDLNELIRRALRSVRMRLESELGDVWVEEKYDDLPGLRIHGERMIQAFTNILDNALQIVAREREDGGRVWIETGRCVQERGDETPQPAVYAKLANNGPRIPAEDLERIFEPFYSKREGGSGLGLPIAYQIVTFSGGQIDVESNDERTIFTIIFPEDEPTPLEAERAGQPNSER